MNTQEPENSTQTQFTFIAHAFRKNGPKANYDTDIIFSVDQSLRQSLAPFDFIPADSNLKVTIELIS